MSRLICAITILFFLAASASAQCSRASGNPMEMQVMLSVADREASERAPAGTPSSKADSDADHSHAGAPHSTDFNSLQVRVELQDSFGTSLKDASPNGEGKVVFGVCSRAAYRVRVTGAEVEETIADNLAPGQGDRVVNLTLHRKGSRKEPTSPGSGAVISASRLNIPRGAQKELERGNTALAAGNLQEARQQFEKAIADYPQFDQAYNNLGVALMQSGDAAGGKAAFEKALAINDHFARALTNLAQLAMDEKRYTDGLDLVRKSLSIEPLNVKSLYLATETAYFSDHLEEVAGYAKALHSMPHIGLALAHFFCAKSFEKRGLRDQALSEYQIFVSEDPKDPNVPKAQMAITELGTPPPARQ